MATFTNENLTINNFMEPISFKEGKGTLIKTKQIQNFFDNKLRFLNGTFSCSSYVVKRPVFLPNLAVKLYGTSSLWWVIARFNGIIYPLSEIKVGQVLYIPDLSELSKVINQTTTTASNSAQQKVVL